VLAAFGTPDEIVDYPPDTMLNYRPSYCIDLLLNSSYIVFRFNNGYLGSTDHGIKIGTSMSDTLAEHGGALCTETHPTGTTGLTGDRVLYEFQNGSVTTSYKFKDDSRDVLYWFSAEQKVTQIVVF
jgi:hypothetical protein